MRGVESRLACTSPRGTTSTCYSWAESTHMQRDGFHLQALLDGVKGSHGHGMEGGHFVLLLAAAGRGAGGAYVHLGAAFLTKLSLEFGHSHPPLGAFIRVSQVTVKTASCSPSCWSWCR